VETIEEHWWRVSVEILNGVEGIVELLTRFP